MKKNRSATFGVSFSLKQCQGFGIDSKETLKFLIEEMGFKRFRLMSYWDEHEVNPGEYDFKELDWQFKMIEKAGGEISLCVGVRQPRWPESHYPEWALKLSQEECDSALLHFNDQVINRYKNRKSLVSWQLENEALNRGFGVNGNFDRRRLRSEFDRLKKLDPKHPIIMTTSNTWGLPIRKPRPDMFGFTLYRTQFVNGVYKKSRLPAFWYSLRAWKIKLITRRSSFIHELQAEPWGPTATQDLSVEEQDKSMSVDQLKLNLELAKYTKLYPLDLWGAEWWYWRKLKGDDRIWRVVYEEVK